jgi:hypothetical protein
MPIPSNCWHTEKKPYLCSKVMVMPQLPTNIIQLRGNEREVITNTKIKIIFKYLYIFTRSILFPAKQNYRNFKP